jgi:hypothetical protein
MPEIESNPGFPLTVAPVVQAPRLSAAVAASIVGAAIVADAGEHATRRFL